MRMLVVLADIAVGGTVSTGELILVTVPRYAGQISTGRTSIKSRLKPSAAPVMETSRSR